MSGGPVSRCGICGGSRLGLVLDLGDQPLAERDDGNRYPLAVAECQDCGLAQLSYEVPRGEVFPADHPYTTGNTKAMREHFGELARRVEPLLGPGDLIADIGANDGTFLAAVHQYEPRARLLAVEPTRQADRARARNIPVEQEPFTWSLARKIKRWLGHAKVIIASNVLAHVSDPHDFMSGVSELLAPDGTFITENHDWAQIVNGLQVDTVYHEHLRFFTPATAGRLLEMHGFLADDIEFLPVHGGSFRTWAVHRKKGLDLRAAQAQLKLRTLLDACRERGQVYGIGATTRATPLIHWAGLGDYLDKVCEVPGSDKIGTVIPGTEIPVVDEKLLIAEQPPYALLLAWHIAADIVPKLRAAGYEGTFITPLPEAGYYRG